MSSKRHSNKNNSQTETKLLPYECTLQNLFITDHSIPVHMYVSCCVYFILFSASDFCFRLLLLLLLCLCLCLSLSLSFSLSLGGWGVMMMMWGFMSSDVGWGVGRELPYKHRDHTLTFFPFLAGFGMEGGLRAALHLLVNHSKPGPFFIPHWPKKKTLKSRLQTKPGINTCITLGYCMEKRIWTDALMC